MYEIHEEGIIKSILSIRWKIKINADGKSIAT